MLPVSSDDVQIVLVEAQPPIVAFSRTQPEGDLRKAIATVRRIAGALSIPMTITTVSLSAEPPALLQELGGAQAWLRSIISPLGDTNLREHIKRVARRTLAVGGMSSEIAILRTVLDARELGYEVHLLMDCCGGLSLRTEAAALDQMKAAGAVISNVSSFFSSQVDDTKSPAGESVMGALADLWSWSVDHHNDPGS